MDFSGQKPKCGQDYAPFWRLQEEPISLSFSSSRSFLHSLAGDPILHLQLQQHQVKPVSHCSLSDFLSFRLSTFKDPCDNVGPPRSSKTFSPPQGQLMNRQNSICNFRSPFPCKVAWSQGPGAGTWLCLVGTIVLPTTNTIRQK